MSGSIGVRGSSYPQILGLVDERIDLAKADPSRILGGSQTHDGDRITSFERRSSSRRQTADRSYDVKQYDHRVVETLPKQITLQG
jgi:hypothetical protein